MLKLVPKFVHVSLREETLMKQCHSAGMGVRKISALTGRSLDTVSKHTFKKHNKKKVQQRCSLRDALAPSPLRP